MQKKRVLLFSEGFGTGHTQAAHALASGLHTLEPAVKAKVIELGKFLNPRVGPMIMNAYRLTVTKQPKLVGMFYKGQYHHSMNRLTQLALHRLFYTRSLEMIRQLNPDLIICSHPIPNNVVARLKRLEGLDIPLYTLITDYDAHGTWRSPEVDRYFVSTEIVRDKLTRHGIPEELIKITGIPVHPKFWQSMDQHEAQQELGLRDLPSVVIMGGGWGLVGDNEHLFNYLNSFRDTTQLIYCVGKNEKAKAEMLADPSYQHENIHIVGFTTEVHKYLDAADLLITKPGGMTCTEGLSKGIPMLFHDAIPGQEEENLDYFVSKGFGDVFNNTNTIDFWMHLIHDRPAFARYRELMITTRNHVYDPTRCAATILDLLEDADQTASEQVDL
jgi:processive 1,2-diacylglycerol beta-glucosyltransferase